MDITSFILGTKVAGSGGAGVKYVVVEELPTTGEEGKIYLVPKEDTQTDNVYNEYMWINNDWELIGDTQADLTDYLKEEDLKTINGNSIVGSGDLSIEPKYITDGNGAKIFFIKYNYTNTVMRTALTEFMKEYKKDNRTIFVIYGSGNNNKDGVYSADSTLVSSIIFKNINYENVKITTDTNGNVIFNKATKLTINFNTTTYEVTSISWNMSEENKTNFLGLTNTTAYTPTGDYNPSTKLYTDKTHYENMVGYDATKTQVLKNINGTLTWVDEA